MSTAAHLPVRFLFVLIVSVATLAPAEDRLTYERHVRPILAAHCFRCHREDSRKAELDVSSATALRRGGESGPVVVPGEPDESLLVELLAAGDMPPEEDRRLSDADVQTIRRWISEGAQSDAAPDTSPTAQSQHDVVPILYRRCVMCHGPEYQLGGLDVRSRESLVAGGNSGAAVLPQRPDESLLVQRGRQRLCPPKADLGEAGIEPMTPDEVTVLTDWIAAGAPWDERPADAVGEEVDPLVTPADRKFWSFQPPRRTSPPTVAAAGQVRNPVDAFLLHRLEAVGLTFNDEADQLTLLRRATFALTGLPPSPEELHEFLLDDRPDAYERMIDRLLMSPRYGEKWSRFWLDLAGYADSEGKRNADTIRPFAYRYRDYVIRSLQRDTPYDEFLHEQIAGDELVDYADPARLTAADIERLVATGFLRMAPDGTSADPVNRVADRIEVIADEIDVLSRGVLGLTLKCARCHSHKYDPIPQRDYYRFVAIFKGAYDEYDWLTPQPFNNQWKLARQRHLKIALPEEAAEIAACNKPLEEEIRQLREQRKQISDPQRAKKNDARVKELQARLRQPPQIRALWDRGRPSPTYVYRRGQETMPGRLVGPGVPSVLTDGQTPFAVEPPRHGTPKTGRRLALARWLTRPDHPLTARVLVNRIWAQHFGRGIVATLDNFGTQGARPSHPELLDWLAVEFMESGWSLKHLHRTLLTSTAFRQSSLQPAVALRLDPDNHWLSRMPMRRLQAEEVRDSLVLLADRLLEQPFGQPDPVDVREDGLVTSKAVQGGWRRSVYVRQRRKEMPTILETFDLPQMNPNCTRRIDSTVVSQPLLLMNNGRIHELSRLFAERLCASYAGDPQKLVARAHVVALGRPASVDELDRGTRAVELLAREWLVEAADESAARRLALTDYCHVLLNSAAFLYVD